MHLTSIEQCSVNQIVWHPVYGKGRIDAITLEGHPRPRIRVKFEDHENSLIFHDPAKWHPIDKASISHLYLFPIVTISQAEYKALEEAIGEKPFKLIQSLYNPEQ